VNQSGLEDFAARYAQAWSSQDPVRVAAFFAENGSLKVNDAPPAVGRTAISGEARSFMEAFPDLKVSFDKLGTDARGTQFHWTLIGTNTGPGGKGKRVRISGYEIWQFSSDGLVAKSEGHFDAAEYARQLEQGINE